MRSRSIYCSGSRNALAPRNVWRMGREDNAVLKCQCQRQVLDGGWEVDAEILLADESDVERRVNIVLMH